MEAVPVRTRALTMLMKAGLLIKLAMSNPSPAAICGRDV